MAGEESQIPVGTQFSPNLIDLGEFTTALVRHSGFKDEQMEAIWRRPVNIRAEEKLQVRKTPRTRSLPLEAAIQYGLLDADYSATELCVALSALSGQRLYDEFARHILLRLGGLRVVEAVQQMQQDGIKVTGDALAAYLTDQGFNVTVHNTAINSLRMWLAKAGLFPDSRGRAWEVDEEVKERLVGIDDGTIASLVGFTDEQRAFAMALCRVAPEDECSAADVRDLAESIVGRRLDRGNLPKIFLEPLRSAGLIEYESRGTRGGKTSILAVTGKFNKEVLEPFFERTVDTLDSSLIAYYKKPLSETYEELNSPQAHVKGRALEAYAIHIMRLLGLRFVAWRKRAKDETGQAEIDVVMAGLMGGVPTRWQIQCKNKPSGSVSIEDVAKEVGLVPLTKATHIMVIANSRVSRDASTYALEVMRHTSLTVIILDRDDFEKIRQSPPAIASIIRAKSRSIERISRFGLNWLSYPPR